MAERQLRPAARNERVVTTVDRSGKLRTRLERVDGREFSGGVNQVGEVVSGYVLDGREMLQCLGTLQAPRHYFNVWLMLMGMQKLGDAADKKSGHIRGYIQTSQRDLQKRTGLSANSVNESMQYWTALPWIRTAKRGVFQLNPFLTVAGSSGEHEVWQREWVDAVGDKFLMPGPNHPDLWRAEQAAARERARELKRLAAMSGDVISIKIARPKAEPKPDGRRAKDLAREVFKRTAGE